MCVCVCVCVCVCECGCVFVRVYVKLKLPYRKGACLWYYNECFMITCRLIFSFVLFIVCVRMFGSFCRYVSLSMSVCIALCVCSIHFQ